MCQLCSFISVPYVTQQVRELASVTCMRWLSASYSLAVLFLAAWSSTAPSNLETQPIPNSSFPVQRYAMNGIV